MMTMDGRWSNSLLQDCFFITVCFFYYRGPIVDVYVSVACPKTHSIPPAQVSVEVYEIHYILYGEGLEVHSEA